MKPAAAASAPNPIPVAARLLRGLLVGLVMQMAGGLLHAMEFSLFNPCEANNTPACQPRILGRGPIEPGDALKLRHMFETSSATAPDGLSGITFDSPGGNLGEGVRMGREIRKLRLNTFASTQLRTWDSPGGPERVLLEKLRCMSACAYAFAGGVNRKVEPGSVLGVHQFASVTQSTDTESTAQTMITLLRIYLGGMGVKPELVDIASLVAPNGMHILTAEEVKRLRVDNTTRQASGWSVSALPSGMPLLRQTAEMSADQQVGVAIFRSGPSYYLLLRIAHRRNPQAIEMFPVGERPEVQIWVDGEMIDAKDATPWERQAGLGGAFTATVKLALADLEAVARGREVELSDVSGGRRLAGVVPYNLPLSSKGLAEGLRLLQRMN